MPRPSLFFLVLLFFSSFLVFFFSLLFRQTTFVFFWYFFGPIKLSINFFGTWLRECRVERRFLSFFPLCSLVLTRRQQHLHSFLGAATRGRPPQRYHAGHHHHCHHPRRRPRRPRQAPCLARQQSGTVVSGDHLPPWCPPHVRPVLSPSLSLPSCP